MPSRGSRSGSNAPRPDIIIDFNCEQGLLFVSLKNIGVQSAYRVCTVFDKPLLGLNGQKCISELQLFRCVEFVPPGKEFSQLVDPVATWFQQGRPNRYTITISYSDRDGKQFRERIVHDLDIYRDLVYISNSGGNDGKPRRAG
jgi:hypothetical protein